MFALGTIALIWVVTPAQAADSPGSGGSAPPSDETDPSAPRIGPASPPPSEPLGGTGGTPSARRPGRPAVQVQISRGVVAASGRSPVRVAYRVSDDSRRARVTIAFVRPTGEVVFRARLGWRRTNVNHRYSWAGSQELRLIPDTSYRVRVSARDTRGNKATRTATVLRPQPPPTVPVPPNTTGHHFPVQGPFSYGGPEARFGAPRSGHTHQGQDILAALGTPVVAPTAGTISWRDYQASGAGYYLVLDASTEAYDYVFMHLQEGSMLVTKGSPVTAGQLIARVGSTGAASATHLHFEVWQGAWQAGGTPIDPLPLLKSWSGS